MLQQRKVLPTRSRPTKKAFRAAVAQMIRDTKAAHGLSNADLGERVGCTGETIGNAENERNDLSALTLANFQHEFGAGAIDHFQALSGARGVPQGTICETDLNTIVRLADAIRKLAANQAPDSEHGSATGPTEAKDTLPILRAALAAIDHEIAKIAPPLRSVG